MPVVVSFLSTTWHAMTGREKNNVTEYMVDVLGWYRDATRLYDMMWTPGDNPAGRVCVLCGVPLMDMELALEECEPGGDFVTIPGTVRCFECVEGLYTKAWVSTDRRGALLNAFRVALVLEGVL